jgi:hypothetical protein
LLILIQEAVAIHIENLDEIGGCLNSKKVIYGFLILFEYEVDVSLVEDALLSKVSLANSLPNFLALASSA